MYEDQELKMKLDNIDDIKLKGTINEGFQGDEIDHRANHNLVLAGGHLGNGHVQTTTQSDYQMNYEHSRTHQEVGTGLIPGLRPANERRRYKVTPSLIGWVQT